jgi:ABC-type glycerol-3-phosphate transport system substrate-binding protein
VSGKKYLLLFFSILFISFVTLTWYLNKQEQYSSKFINGNTREAVGEPSVEKHQETVRLKVAVSMEAKELAILQQFSQGFVNRYPYVELEFIRIPADSEEAYSWLKNGFQINEAPDVLLIDNNWVIEFASQGYLHHFDDFYGNTSQNVYVENLLSAMQWNGHYWAMPLDIDPYILVWNNKILTFSKMDKSPWNSTDFMALNQRLMEPLNGQYGLYFNPADPAAFINAVWALGGKWFDPDKGTAPAERQNISGLISKLLLPLDWRNEQWVSPGQRLQTKDFYPYETEQWQPWRELKEGRIAMMVATYSEFKKHAGRSLVMEPLPIADHRDIGNGALIKGRSFVIFSGTSVKTEALDWIKAVTIDSIQQRLEEESDQIPVISSAFNSYLLKNGLSPDQFTIQLKEMAPYTPDLQIRLDAVQAEKVMLWKGETDIETFIKQVQRLWIEEGQHNF